MKNKIISTSILLILITSTIFAQNEEKRKAEEKAKELKNKAAQMLIETRDEINTLRTIENRISFTSELANLMWYHDADEGKRMFINITDDYTEIMGRYNAEVVSYGGIKSDSELYRGMMSPDAKSRVMAKMTKAIGVRQQVALSIAAHDAELGTEFIDRTSQIVTDTFFQEQILKQDKQLESAIIAFMAGQDIDKALAFARKKLKKGFRRSMLTLLDKVHKKDASKAESFASEILSKVSSDLSDSKPTFRDTYSILNFGKDNLDEIDAKTSKKPIFSKSSMNSLADDFADALISKSDEAKSDYRLDSYHTAIKNFSPTSAKRLAKKFEDYITDTSSVESVKDTVKGISSGSSPPPPPAPKGGGFSTGSETATKEQLSNRKSELFAKLNEKGFKELPKEEKQRVITEAQSIVTSFKNPTEKIAGLSTLATTVKQLGDQELASELMNEASLLVNQQPKNYLDYMQIWTLATGYSSVDPEKTFPILENTIYQLNDTLEAFVKVGEFIDVGENLVIDNEVQLGSFGGAMTQGFIGQIGASEGVIKSLAEADFDKTKQLAERFSRTELRILVKMMIMRSVLDDGKNKISRRDMRNNTFLF